MMEGTLRDLGLRRGYVAMETGHYYALSNWYSGKMLEYGDINRT